MLNLLIQFAYLQALDLLTTLAFLGNGVEEANPLVTWLASSAGSPLHGLMVVKLFGLLLGWYCWRSKRQRLLGRVNVFYALLVAWNLVALVLGSVGRAAT